MSFFSAVEALPAINYVDSAGEAVNYAGGPYAASSGASSFSSTIKAITDISGIITQAAGVYGQYQAQRSQKNAIQNMSNFNMAQIDADIEALETKKAYDISVQEAANRKLKSRHRVLLAKAGVDINRGSPLLTRIYESELMDREVDVIEYNANIAINKAKNKKNYYEWMGDRMVDATDVNIGTTLLTGVGRLYNSTNTKSFWDEV